MQRSNYTRGDSDVILSTLVTGTAAMLEVYYVAAVWRRNFMRPILMQTVACRVESHRLRINLPREFSDSCILTRSLFALTLLPTWRRGFVLRSMMSSHLMYRKITKGAERTDGGNGSAEWDFFRGCWLHKEFNLSSPQQFKTVWLSTDQLQTE